MKTLNLAEDVSTMERAVRELGLRGAEICSNINGKNLDDKSFTPFYTKLQELEVPVFIHPSNVLGADRLRSYHLQNLIGNPIDTAVAAASLMFLPWTWSSRWCQALENL